MNCRLPLVAAAAVITVLACAGGVAAAPITYTAILNGPSEFPVNASPGTGTATVTIDTVTHLMTVDVTFGGLLGTTTASHIHVRTPPNLTGGVATQTPTFGGFPLGVSSGSYQHTFDMTLAPSYNPAFITNNGGLLPAETALFTAIASGNAYLNIHTNLFPGGEIRGFLEPAHVPEPTTLLLVGLGAAALAGRRFRIGRR